MVHKKHKLKADSIPDVLRSIPTPPSELYVIGDNFDELLRRPRVAIVGSRKITPYGKAVTDMLARELAAQGVIIVSGLALGVDSVAHNGALEAQGGTIAVLPCGLNTIYPRSHTALARQIIQRGGALLSEYPDGTEPFPGNFVARNRLIAGLADIVLITEAAEKNGTVHTANFALAQGKTVMCVPGNITSAQSRGTNNLIKHGALLVNETADVLCALGLQTGTTTAAPRGSNEHEQTLLDLLAGGVIDGHELLAQSKLELELFNQTLTMLEITGKIKALGANQWALA